MLFIPLIDGKGNKDCKGRKGREERGVKRRGRDPLPLPSEIPFLLLFLFLNLPRTAFAFPRICVPPPLAGASLSRAASANRRATSSLLQLRVSPSRNSDDLRRSASEHLVTNLDKHKEINQKKILFSRKKKRILLYLFLARASSLLLQVALDRDLAPHAAAPATLASESVPLQAVMTSS